MHRLRTLLLFVLIVTCCSAASLAHFRERNGLERTHHRLRQLAQKVVGVGGRTGVLTSAGRIMGLSTDVRNLKEEQVERQQDPPRGVQVSGSATGDPHFTGFQGQLFDFMGRPGTTFNILTDKKLVVNARFVAGPQGKKQTFMGAVGLKFGDARLKIQECGFRMVCGYLDGNELKMGDVKVLENGAVIRKKAHTVERIEVDIPSEGYKFKFASPKADKWNMPHLDIHAALTKIPDDAHGILGQTARGLKPGGLNSMDTREKYKPRGKDLDYAVSHLFSHDFKFNRYMPDSARIAPVSRRLLNMEDGYNDEDLDIIAEAHITSGWDQPNGSL